MNTMLEKPEFRFPWRMQRDLDRILAPLGFDRLFFQPADAAWTPDLEVFEYGNELVVKADVPGMKRQDLTVEINEKELTITGERKIEREDKNRKGFRSERTYGRF